MHDLTLVVGSHDVGWGKRMGKEVVVCGEEPTPRDPRELS